MIRTILVPLDRLKAAETALPWVRYAARATGATVRLLTILRSQESRQRAEAEDYLAARASELRAGGVNVEADIAVGDPAQIIVGRSGAAGLTVLSSGTTRWLISAVLDRVLQDMTGPLVVVRAAPDQAATPPEPRKILTPLDTAGYSGEILPVVSEAALSLNASIVLCHVVAPFGDYEAAEDAPPGVARVMQQLIGEAEELIDRAAESLRARGIETETAVSTGEPVREIIRTAQAREAGLIAMATRGRDRLHKRFMGSVANRVLESTSIPCLLVRPVEALAAPESRDQMAV
jgi:nucleotide-binding universal stress UspA family protein